MKKKMETKKKLTNIGLAVILVITVFAAVMGIASAQTHYNETGEYIEGINVSVNTSDAFNRSYINVPLTFQINNTLNESATSFNVTNQLGLTTNATGRDLAANEWFWVNATKAGTYWVNVSNNDNSSEYVNFTVEYFFLPPEVTTITIEIKPETLNLASKGVFTAFITNVNVTAINISTVECEGAPAVRGMASEEDNGTYIVKFNRQDLVNVTEGGAVMLTVTGELNDGTLFEGNDTIRVIDKGKVKGKGLPGQWFSEVKKWAKKVHKKFLPFDDDAIASSSDEAIVTVTETSTNTMHIINIDMSTDSRKAGPNRFVWAVATVTIVDEYDNLVGGATVSGHWSELTSDTDSGTTGSDGKIALNSDSVKNAHGTFTFTVTGVERDGWIYDSDANKETSDSITA